MVKVFADVGDIHELQELGYIEINKAENRDIVYLPTAKMKVFYWEEIRRRRMEYCMVGISVLAIILAVIALFA